MTRAMSRALAAAVAVGVVPPATAAARPMDLVARATPAPQPVLAPTPDGFDWGDAGIGAAAGIGLSALAVGGSLVIVGKRRHAPAR